MKAHHGVGPQFLAAAHHLQPHAALEVAAGHAQEGDAVAVAGVHVGLDLEHHAAELALLGPHFALDGRAHAGRRRQVDQAVQHFLHAEVVDRRAEEHRRLPAGQEFGFVEGRSGVAHQLDLALAWPQAMPKRLRASGVVQAVMSSSSPLARSSPARTPASGSCAGPSRRRTACPCPPAR
jgi:hypothetical protein